MKFYSAWYCPFAQRVWMTLLHKTVEFDYIEIDPYDKTSLWLNISRGSGQVPVLEFVTNEEKILRVINSLRIMEFIDDYYQDIDPELFPKIPEQRAEAKFWIDFISTRIIPYFYRFLKAHEAGETREVSKANMLESIGLFTQSMSDQGPYFMGSKYGAVDIAFIPFAYRIDLLLAHYRDFQLLSNLSNWKRYKYWYEAVIAEPAFVKSSTVHPNYESRLIDFYLPYSLGSGQSDVTAI
jgi:glutathione S-transferase